VGGNLFTLVNPSAIRFIRINADNTVSVLSDSDFRTAIGAGTSSSTGTVTSIATNNGVTGGTITSTGTIGLTGQALALHNLASNGLIIRTGSGTVAARTITGTANQITVSNGDGVSGNPTLSTPQNIHTAASPTFAGLSLSSQLTSTSTTPLSFQSNSNTGTYNQTTIYANQNNTSANTANGIFIERGRLTDSAVAEVRYLVIGARGGQIQWQVDGVGATSQTGNLTISAATATLSFSSATGAKTISTGGSTDLFLSPGGNVRIGTAGTAVAAKLQVGGDIRAKGEVVAYAASDKNLKDNIQKIESPLEIISKIGGYTFDWNKNQQTYTGKDYGVIAQEIEEVMPELVITRESGYKAVNYKKLYLY
jgi:hypothetical protein